MTNKQIYLTLLLIISCSSGPKPNISIQQIKGSSSFNNEIKRKDENRFTYSSRNSLIKQIDKELSDEDIKVELKMLPKVGRLTYIPPLASLNKIEIRRNGNVIKVCPVNSSIVMSSSDCVDKDKEALYFPSLQNTCGSGDLNWPKIICDLNNKLLPGDEIIAIDANYDSNNSVYKIQNISQ